MIIQVKIGEFRNRLSSYLKKMRSGAEIVISDRDTPVGRLVPFSKQESEKELILLEPPKGYQGLSQLKFPPSSFSAVGELLKERRSR